MTTMPIFCTNAKGTFFNQDVRVSIRLGNNTKLLSILKDSNVCELRDSAGTTLLHLAARYDNEEFAKYLINAGADVDAKNQQKRTPLKLAVAFASVRVVRLLLEDKNDLLIPDIHGRCVLQKILNHRLGTNQDVILEFQRKLTVESLRNSEHVASEMFHRDCPLYKFMRLNNVEVTRILLEKGSPVDAKMPVNGRTALFAAAKLSNLECIELLLEYNADVNARDHTGRTPLAHISPVSGEGKALETVKMLIAAGAILIDYTSRVNMLSQLLTDGDREIVRTLLELKIDLLFEDKEGLTSLHYLAKNACANVLEELPKMNFNANFRCREGRTLLHYAAEVKNPSSVKFLLDRDADVNARDHQQRTPLYAAVHRVNFDQYRRDPDAYSKNWVNCTEILLERGVDPHILVEDNVGFLNQHTFDAFFKKIRTPFVAKIALDEVSSGRVNDSSMRRFIVSHSLHKTTFDSIKRQLEEMKQREIDDSMTLFEFLTANDHKIARLARNEKFVSNLTELMKEFNSIPYYLNRRFLKINHLVELRKTLLPVINDVLLKFCSCSVDNIAEQIIDYLHKETWTEIL